MMKNIPIFFTFNNIYTIPACVALYSLLNKAKRDIFYEMHVLHTDISKENQDLILKTLSKFTNYKLIFNNVGIFPESNWENGNWGGNNKENSEFPKETVLKCYAARFFPQYDKILYSDVDVVFAEDISGVYNEDMDSYYCAGVSDFLQPDYLAAGFLFFNLKKIREDNAENVISSIINDDNIEKRQLEQDVLNTAFKGKIKFLPLNYISYPYLYDDYMKKASFRTTYTRDELYDSIINPKIIHYASVKPWNGVIQKSELWWDIFHYLNLPRTPLFKSKHSKRKLALKNITNAFLVIAINLPLLKNIFSDRYIQKVYKSAKKYLTEVLNQYD